MNKLITTLYAYNSSIFTGYFDGTINSFKMPSDWYKVSQNVTPYSFNISATEKYVVDLQGYKGVLFVSSFNHLYSFDLKKEFLKNEIFSKNIDKCTKMKIDYDREYLFAASEERCIVALKISNPRNPKYICDIDVKCIKEPSQCIVDLAIHEQAVFLAVRNLGIVRIDYSKDFFGEPKVIRTINKLSLEDPQDVKYEDTRKCLYIADSEKGFIVLNICDNEILFEARLPRCDSPKKIIVLNKNALIQGSNGLYLYNIANRTIEVIFEFKIGAIAKYGNNIIYSRNGVLNLLVLGNKRKTEVFNNENEYGVFKEIFNYKNHNLAKYERPFDAFMYV